MNFTIPKALDGFILATALALVSITIFVPASIAQTCTPDVPHIEGEWSTLPYLMPINPISATLLRNGKVLIVSGSENDAWNNSSGSQSYRNAIWDPTATTQSSITIQNMEYDVFCSGTAALPDGRALVVGGTSDYIVTGDNRSSIFDPATGSFLQSQSMVDGRWYATATALGDGRVMVFSGLSLSGGTNNTVEIYDLKSAGAGWSSPATAPFTPPLYPRMILLPNGRVFLNGQGAGSPNLPNSWIFNPVPRTWSVSAPTTGDRNDGSAVLLPLLAPNYTPKVMNFGGGYPGPATNSTEIIDLSGASPSWQPGPNMSTGRHRLNAVILPDGKVLVQGGSVNLDVPDEPGKSADLYDPVTNTFSSGGTSSFSHLYHSSALLLPDATVVSMGSNLNSGSYEPGIEIYRPPYLFNANDEMVTDRPAITSVAPGVIGYNSTFSVNYSSSLAITSAVLVRPGSPTHSFDMDQRLIGLCGPSPQPACNGSSGTLTLTSPPNGNIAPPGHYMLFLLDSAGVPSVAQFIQLSLYTTVPPEGTITSPAANTTISAGGTVSFGTNITAAQYSWIFPGGSTPTSTAQNPGNVTFNSPGTYVVSLTVIDSSGNSDPSPSTRTITVLPTTANFSIAVSPTSVAVVPGQSATFTVTVTSLTGFKGTVNLSVGSEGGFPTGITSGGFSPASITSSGSSTLTINTTTSAKPYALSLTVTGTSKAITHTGSTTLLVNLAPPANLTATAGNGQVALSWPVTNGATGYNIKRGPIAGGPYVMVGCATSTSFTDTGLLNGKTYYYVVSATYTGSPNGGGESRNSIEASATPVAPPPPPPPTGLTATPGNGQVVLNWNASSGASSYNLKRATINGGPYTTIASPFSTNFTDSGLTNSTTYYYVVSAVNSGGESQDSSQVSATPSASAPTLTSLSPSSATAGGAAFTLTVNGTNFVSGATVRWNGTARSTTFVGSAQLTAAILASDIATIGTAQVTVLNPNGTISNSLTFTVNASPSVAAYSFNEGAGTLLGDSSGNNNTGTINGAAIWTTQGQYGNALSFDGVNDYVNIPANSSIGNLTSNFTMSAWVFLNNLTSVHTIWDTAESPSSSIGISFRVDTTGRLIFTTKGVKDYASLTASVATGVWAHVAVVLNSSFAATFFVNGVQKDTITHTVGGNANTTQATFIGASANDTVSPTRNWMAGRIDNLRIYNRALTPVEIQNDMNTPIGTVANTAPTISTIAPQSTNEDTATNAIPYTVGDGETAAGSLTVSGGSSNTTLVPNANIVFGGSGANRTVTVTPAANQNGTATITVTVSDGQLSTPTSFLLTVTAVNDAPTITSIAAQTTTSGTAVGPLNFTIGDVETAAGSLTVSGSSSNQTLVPDANITFGGSGANRTVTVTPAAAQTGTATITITVSDGQLSTPTSFLLTVNATNTAPTISTIAPQTTNEDTATGAIAFTVDDGETAVASLTLSGSSSNATLIPNANITFGGSGANRTVTVTPALNQNGTATITVTVSDGQLSTPTSFLLTVTVVNDAPTITSIAAQTTTSGTAVGPLSFTIGDVETAATSLTVSGSSSNQTLVPDANITFGGSGANRTVTVTPVAAQSGTATITVSVSDGQLSTPTSFLLTVTASNTAPTISTIAAQSTNEDTATGAIAFTVDDGETAAGSLTLSGSSSNTTVVPNANIVFGGSGANRTVTVTPAPNQNGTVTITVTVSDGQLSTPTSFLLTVNAVNDVPTITSIAAQTTTTGTAVGPISFTIGDVETAAGSLTVSGSSANTTLVPNANIVFGGSAANRTVTVTPAAGQSGTATITVTVSDSQMSTPTSFLLTVNADSVAPETTLTATPNNPSTNSNASFGFTSTEPGSFQCQIDGAGFAACNSPQNYTGLSQGSHNFQVQAIDLAGNLDLTPASYSWTIDSIAPDTTITVAPGNPSNSSSASFSFTSTEAGSFQCQIDGAGFAACTSPQNYTALTQGSHTFQVRAIDLAGNSDPTPASSTWTYTPVTLFPASTVILIGSLQGGTVSSLNADDNNYYEVNSNSSGNRATSWFAAFAGVSNTLSNLKITYKGKISRNNTQTIAIWRWDNSTWVQLDSRKVSTTEIEIANLSPTGILSNFVSPAGELRVQVNSTGNAPQNFFTSGDLMQIVYDIP